MFFISKIRGTAEGVGVSIQFARSIDGVLEMAASESPSLIIADLHAQCCDPFDMARRLRADEHLKNIPLLGFFSHVQTSLQQKAEGAGYDRVLARSSFSKNLANILMGSF